MTALTETCGQTLDRDPSTQWLSFTALMSNAYITLLPDDIGFSADSPLHEPTVMLVYRLLLQILGRLEFIRDWEAQEDGDYEPGDEDDPGSGNEDTPFTKRLSPYSNHSPVGS